MNIQITMYHKVIAAYTPLHHVDAHLFLGGVAVYMGHNANVLKDLHIKHIISFVHLKKEVVGSLEVRGIHYHEFARSHKEFADDAPQLIPKVVQLIRNLIDQGENVLVHCRSGMNRSAAAVLAYLMDRYAVGYDKAYIMLKKRRPCIRNTYRHVLETLSFSS